MSSLKRNRLGQFARVPARRRTPRNDSGKFAKPPAKRVLITSWILTALSIILLWFCTTMVTASFSAFRSCSSNNNGLTLSNCGKASLNFGDLVLIVLFILAAALTLSLATHAWRLTRRSMP